MIPVLLIVIPLLSGLAGFYLKKGNNARDWALFSSILTLAVAVAGLSLPGNDPALAFDAPWISAMRARFTVSLDGMGQLLCLLTAITFPAVFVATWNRSFPNPRSFFGLMLLSQAGLMGVFLAMDYLLFYFFWELALIPVYFLCSRWGGEKRIQVTFKFFIYTFIGSLLMLIGIIYLYYRVPDHNFAINSFYKLKLTADEQTWIFWLFFVAFAIKMPIFPFHTWQPDTYEQSPTAVTMVMSAVMVKMGVFAIIRWLAPVLPVATWQWQDTVSGLAITGMIYASIIAIRQNDLKRLIAYSSIAHIGLMVIAIFARNESGMKGAMVQMFNHGINILGLWIVAELIERKYGTRKLSELGGLARKAPALAIFFVIIAMANIALPLTNAFAGEFLMFNGVLSSTITGYSVIFTVTAGLSIILAAVYTLRMLQKTLFGETNALTENATDIAVNEKIILAVVVAAIFIMGVFPQPMLDSVDEIAKKILTKMDFRL